MAVSSGAVVVGFSLVAGRLSWWRMLEGCWVMAGV